MSKPMISVLMGAYNAAGCVGRAIESIQAQTLQDWELVICDDGSTDNTWDILLAYRQQDGRINLLRHGGNKGLAAALNTCLRHAGADLCARQDADDWSSPERLATQVQAFDEDPELAIVGTAVWFCDDNDREWGMSRPIEWPVARDLVRGTCFAHASVMYRKSAVLAAGSYDEHAIRCEDYDLWFRLLSHARGRNLPEALVRVCWPLSAYGRRHFRHRITAVRVRWGGYRQIRAPWYAYPYVLKPLLVGLVPKRLLWLYHAARMRAAPSGI